MCPVVVPSSIFASGNLGVDFLGFSRYTALSDAKCDQAFCCMCLSMHLCIYLISFFFLITQTFCKGNEEQLSYIECWLSLEIYLFLIFWKKPSIAFIKVLNICWNFQEKVIIYHFCCLRLTVLITCVMPTLKFTEWAPRDHSGHPHMVLHFECPWLGPCCVLCDPQPPSRPQ